MADHSTQLACPHCGSTLTFGMEIAAGTPVECLICMQTFEAVPMSAPASAAPTPVAAAAASIYTADAPTMSDTTTTAHEMPRVAPAKAAPAKPAPAAGIPVGKTAVSAKAPILTSAKANPDAELPTPPIRKPVSSSPMGGKLALLAVALGLAFLLTGGIVFAIVKITTSARSNPAKSDTPLANNGNTPNTGDNGKEQPANNPDPDNPPPDTKDQGSTNAPVTPEEEEQLRNKIREETKQLLKRKVAVDGGEVNWQPVAFNQQQQQALGLTQQKINAAIDKGVVFLKQSQQPNGTWNNGHGVGHAAIGGLTLLECGVPAKDPNVQRAAVYVRSNIARLGATYELSLAILFLDRLGDKRDRPFIQGMAMRLIAGQYESGGWHYQCPLLTPNEMVQLYSFLHATKKPNLLDPLQGRTPNANLVDPLRDPNKADDALQHFGQLANPQMPAPKAFPPKGKGKAKGPAFVAGKGVNPLAKRAGQGDNSNTQFALLALWTARRHDVPSDAALLKAFERFKTTQNADFGWGYTPRGGSTNTMTSVGLLGMAMGHGVNPEVIRFNPKDPKDLIVKPALQDQRIQNGLQALARNIGQPSTQKNPNLPMQNLYFLWSVERVAMLYDLRTIGGKDWYSWGAQILVHNQHASGAWQQSGGYPGGNPPLNTCFALLFLKRSNLVQDLTNHLRLYSGIRDSESKNP